MYKILCFPFSIVKDPQKNQFYHLSRYFKGDLITPILANNLRNKEMVKVINLVMGNFNYHVAFSPKLNKLINFLFEFLFWFYKGFYLCYKHKYDAIFVRDTWKAGLIGFFLKKLTGTKLIVHVRGNVKKGFLMDSEHQSIMNICKSKIVEWISCFVLNRSDHIMLLYPDQINQFTNINNKNITIIHGFVPISNIQPAKHEQLLEKYILFLGHPWFLKGVDILIKAFKMVSNEFPDYKLKIVGYCPDKTYFEKLAEGNNSIELCNPVFHDDAMKLMYKCTLFVLPSRTEGMGRVLLEAMASKKPIIASNVDGIPYYVKHGFNGLLFESENIKDLAEKIRTLLNNPDYAAKLAENGYKYVHENLSENHYVEYFKKMIEKTFQCSEKR